MGAAKRAERVGPGMLAIERLRELPLSERRDELEDLVVTEFRTTLLMAEYEELPFDASYFELGFTSLRITEIKERLETQLGRAISTNVLFNSPTMERLISYLVDEVLADLFRRTLEGGAPS
jgi:acyl carrier protein